MVEGQSGKKPLQFHVGSAMEQQRESSLTPRVGGEGSREEDIAEPHG